MEKLGKRGSMDIFDLIEMKFPTTDGINALIAKAGSEAGSDDDFRQLDVRIFRRSLLETARGHMYGETTKEYGTNDVREWRNISSLYRSMSALEKRGLVGGIINIKPRTWVKVEVNGHELSVTNWNKATQRLAPKFILAFHKRGWLIRASGYIWQLGPEHLG